jgi:SAM-dependent methyltransferase
MECLFCHTVLEHKILDLGHSPLANAYLTNDTILEPETFYPLKVYVCDNCFLVQLFGRTKPENIFNESYAYLSASSQTWKQHCKDYVTHILPLLPAGGNPLVVELGSNDGTLINEFIKANVEVLGIDPALTASTIASNNGIPVITDFFTAALAKILANNNKQADLIIGNNVLAHVPGINDFMGGIATLLKAKGICTLEFPYLPNLFKHHEFDTIYHEHFFYFSLTVINRIVSAHGLSIFDIKQLDIHGGSMRVYLQHNITGIQSVSPAVSKQLEIENAMGIGSLAFYNGLQESALQIKKVFLSWLIEQTMAGKKIMAYGAAAKGNTFLNFCGVKKDLIPFISDVTIQKQGKFLPGSHIPIVNEEIIKEFQPDYIVVLPWNFKEEINDRLHYVKQWNGKLVYFIPDLQVH